MAQTFAEIIGDDESLLALLRNTGHDSSSIGNIPVHVSDIGGVW